MYSEHGWTMTRHATKTLLSHLTRTNQRIGEPSAFGVVYKLMTSTGNDCQFVLKTIKIPRQIVSGFSLNFNTLKSKVNRENNRPGYLDRMKTFKTEVSVGSLKNIGEVGPRVYAWRVTPTGGEYIMDNVQMGDKKAKVYPLAHIKMNEKILERVLGTVKRFQQITKGHHGDLHRNNIQVIKLPNKKFYVMIIDYGSWRSERALKSIGLPVSMHYGMNVYLPEKRGTPFIKNENMIKRMSLNTGS
jgi:hypothetical protein